MTCMRALPVWTAALVGFCATAPGQTREADKFWHQWRGPLASGVAPHGDPPVEWSESKNVRWKVAVPGRGHASPIVWGERIYILTAVPTATGDAAAAPGPEGAAQIRTDSQVQPFAFSEGAQDRPESSREQDRAQDGPRRRGRPQEGQGAAGEREGRGRDGQERGREGGERGGRRGPPRREKPNEPFKYTVLAIERATGKTAWEKVVQEEKPHEAGHPDATYASPSPVTDGKHLWVSFGSRGLYCLDLKDGKVVWEKDLGDMRTRNEFGEGSSPALHGDTLVVNWDHEGDDFIVALDARTGEARWRAERDEPTTWSTPVFVEAGGKTQVVTSGTNRIRAYDLASGTLVWECEGLTQNVIPSPVAADGMLYAISGFRGNALKAIRVAGAEGDISGSHKIVWAYEKNTPYVPSPLLYGEGLYFVDNNRAILTRLNARDGKVEFGPQRIEEVQNVYASLVGAAGRVYLAGRDGTTAVLQHGPEFKLLAVNELDEGFDASPAIVDKELYLRGTRHLYCIAQK